MSDHRRTTPVVLVVLVVWTLAVFAVTMWPTPVDQGRDETIGGVIAWLHSIGVPPWFDRPHLEFGANVVMFAPGGFAVAWLLVGRAKPCPACLAGVVALGLASVALEGAQAAFRPARHPSMLDVAANTAGALLGAGAWLATRALRARLAQARV